MTSMPARLASLDFHGTAAEILIASFQRAGIKRAFCVPGESFLACLDALRDSDMDLITARHEAAAANMAEAQGKLGPEPGLVFVSRGPGVTHASIALHTAMQDQTPMIVVVGDNPRCDRHRDAFQEVNYRTALAEYTKAVFELDQPERIPELVGRALHEAQNGRPGPVALVIPEDIQNQVLTLPLGRPPLRVTSSLSAQDLSLVQQALATAAKPVIVLGGPHWSPQAGTALARWAEEAGIPLVTSFRRQDFIDNRSPAYVGMLGLGASPKLKAAVQQADLIIMLGAPFSETLTQGYALFDLPSPQQRIIQIAHDASELARVYQPDICLLAQADLAALALAETPIPPTSARQDWLAQLKAAYQDFIAPVPSASPLNLSQSLQWLSGALPDGAVVSNGAGNYAAWLHRFFQYKGFGTQLAPQNGAMGYGLPAAVSAAVSHADRGRNPERPVVCFAGDGCFLMASHELATIAQEDLKLIIVVVNNGAFGTIRMHQERRFPGRPSGTGITNPDFVALAQAYGLAGERVSRTEDFAPAFQRALQAPGTVLLELVTQIDDLAPGVRL